MHLSRDNFLVLLYQGGPCSHVALRRHHAIRRVKTRHHTPTPSFLHNLLRESGGGTEAGKCHLSSKPRKDESHSMTPELSLSSSHLSSFPSFVPSFILRLLLSPHLFFPSPFSLLFSLPFSFLTYFFSQFLFLVALG